MTKLMIYIFQDVTDGNRAEVCAGTKEEAQSMIKTALVFKLIDERKAKTGASKGVLFNNILPF